MINKYFFIVMNYKLLFLNYENYYLKKNIYHFAPHSHHPWMDISKEGQLEYWEDSNRLLDDKWNKIFNEIIPKASSLICDILQIKNKENYIDNITYGQNTFDLLIRLFSSLFIKKWKHKKPITIITSDCEYHTFNRLINSIKENFDFLINIEYLDSTLFYKNQNDLIKIVKNKKPDILFFSHIFFKTGCLIPNLEDIIIDIRKNVNKNEMDIIIDGYHSFCAVPFSIDKIKNEIFYLAGGYKYAMSGEGVCFLYSPDYGLDYKPVLSGWMSNFSKIEEFNYESKIEYDKNPFIGSTFDSSGIYRFIKTWDYRLYGNKKEVLSIEFCFNYIKKLQKYFIQNLNNNKIKLVEKIEFVGNYLAFECENNKEAIIITKKLKNKNIIIDNRENYIRIGFSIYHSFDEIDYLLSVLN